MQALCGSIGRRHRPDRNGPRVSSGVRLGVERRALRAASLSRGRRSLPRGPGDPRDPGRGPSRSPRSGRCRQPQPPGSTTTRSKRSGKAADCTRPSAAGRAPAAAAGAMEPRPLAPVDGLLGQAEVTARRASGPRRRRARRAGPGPIATRSSSARPTRTFSPEDAPAQRLEVRGDPRLRVVAGALRGRPHRPRGSQPPLTGDHRDAHLRITGGSPALPVGAPRLPWRRASSRPRGAPPARPSRTRRRSRWSAMASALPRRSQPAPGWRVGAERR